MTSGLSNTSGASNSSGASIADGAETAPLAAFLVTLMASVIAEPRLLPETWSV